MEKSKVTREVAEQEITDWLDKKKVFQSTREGEGAKQNIEDLINALMDGVIEIGEDGVIKHNLIFPAGMVKDFTYQLRLNDKMLQPYMKGVAMGDGDGRFIAMAAALTDQPKAVLTSLDSGTDKKIMQAIVFFFI